jgi:hypothetical protein
VGSGNGRVDAAGIALPLARRHRPEIVAAVRTCVRGLLEQSQAFAAADPEERRAVAQKMVRVALVGAHLAAEDRDLSEAIATAAAASPRSESAPPLAAAQSAGDQMGMQAAKAAGGALTALKNAIDFPTFVTSLINGVFQAVTSSAITQLSGLSDLLDNVSTSADSFAEQNVRDEDVVSWSVGKFPFLKREEGGGLSLREGTELMAQSKTLQSGLSATDAEVSSIDEADLLGTLGPLVRRKIGRDRQQILGTLVQMGLQRIVVDEGRLHASMDMRVDTRSLSEEDKQSRTELGVEAKASGSFGVGAWGASASVGTSFSSVQSDHQYTKEELDTRAGLRSSVDLAFRTEQIPLDRMADKQARVRIDANARVPANVSDGASLISSDSHVGPVPPPAHRPALDTPAPPAKKPEQKTAPEKKPDQKPEQKADQKPAPTAKKPDQKPAPVKTPPDAKKPAEKTEAPAKEPVGAGQP